MRKSFVALALTSLLVIALTLSAQAAVTTNIKVPTNFVVNIPCSGDVVVGSGNLHILATATADGNGGFHIKTHSQPQGVSGTVTAGPNIGVKYQGVGVTQDQTNLKVGSTFTFINRFDWIGQGTAPNLRVHNTVHLTVNANGVVTANVVKTEVTCK